MTALLAAGLLACGASFSTRPATPPEAEGPQWTEPPAGPVDLAQTWEQADEAFLSGDLIEAQRLFGVVYLVEPNHRAGQVVAALNETCRILGNDCLLITGRLDALRLEYAGLLGPREQWVPQQQADYEALLTCYDQALNGELERAREAAEPVLGSPLPVFGQLAYQCVDRVHALQNGVVRESWPRASRP
jgi:hypothetical protein